MTESKFYKKLNKQNIQCQLCSHFCTIKEGKFGECQVRKNYEGKLYSLIYGYPIAQNNHLNPATSGMSAFTFALYDTCRKVAWITKKAAIQQVTIDLDSQHHFIYNTGTGIFSTTLQKGNCRLGYLRLLIPTYISRIEETLQEASQAKEKPHLMQPMNRFLTGFFSSFQTQTLPG